jgi:hypothetical protein
MNLDAFFDELEKLGAISHEQARRSLDRLSTLEQTKPTGGQVARYGALGAMTVPAIGALGNVIAGKPLGGAREIASQAVKGALTAGAVPFAQKALDRRAEMGTLQKFMQENAPGA